MEAGGCEATRLGPVHLTLTQWSPEPGGSEPQLLPSPPPPGCLGLGVLLVESGEQHISAPAQDASLRLCLQLSLMSVFGGVDGPPGRISTLKPSPGHGPTG